MISYLQGQLLIVKKNVLRDLQEFSGRGHEIGSQDDFQRRKSLDLCGS